VPSAKEENMIDGDVIRRERQWAMFLHFSQFCGFIVPIAGLLVPIIIWQVKRVDLPSLEAHGKVVVNWLISAFIYAAIFFLLVFVAIGIPLLYVLGLLAIIFPLVGGIKANQGEVWKYPLSFRFIK
jgi:uncharacterized Tic20 family protein